MKKMILLSLSLLMAAGTIQPAFGMDGESQELKKAKENAQSVGTWAGLMGGSISALGILGFLNAGKKDVAYGLMAFAAGSIASTYAFNQFKRSAYSKIRNNNDLTSAEKKEAKKAFHKRDFGAHILAASVVVASGPSAASSRTSQPSILAVFPLTLGSMFIFKTFSYQLARMNHNKKQPARFDNNL